MISKSAMVSPVASAFTIAPAAVTLYQTELARAVVLLNRNWSFIAGVAALASIPLNIDDVGVPREMVNYVPIDTNDAVRAGGKHKRITNSIRATVRL